MHNLNFGDSLIQLFSLLCSLFLTGLVTYLFAIRKAKALLRFDIEKDIGTRRNEIYIIQRYDYFLRFKWFSDEFRRRISHIIRRLSEDGDKYENMVIRLKQDISLPQAQELSWYFCDAIGTEGGYYFASTIYMNCLFLNWLKKIQWEYPYIPLHVGNEDSADDRKRIEEYNRNITDPDMGAAISNECDFYIFSKNLKLAVGGNKGVPYGIQDSIGDFLFDDSHNRVLNYEEFCRLLVGKESRIKFMPIVKFWRNVISADDTVDQEVLEKLTQMRRLLKLIEISDIRNK